MEKKNLKPWGIERLLSFRPDALVVRLAPVMLHYTPGGIGAFRYQTNLARHHEGKTTASSASILPLIRPISPP